MGARTKIVLVAGLTATLILTGLTYAYALQPAQSEPKTAVTVTKAATEETPAPIDPAVMEQEMVTLTNRYRAEQGLNFLAINDKLMHSAQMKADDLCATGNWAHTDSQGRGFEGFINDSGYVWQRSAENLSRRFATQDEAFAGLLASPGHHANIVGQYEEIGVGFSECGGENYTAMHYGETA